MVDPALVGAITGASVLLLTVFGFIAKKTVNLVKWLLRISHRTEQFLEDFHGVPQRPGVAARPGVMERLQTIEGTLGVVQAELSYNSGSSVKDAVRRIDNNVQDLARAQSTGPQVAVNVHQ